MEQGIDFNGLLKSTCCMQHIMSAAAVSFGTTVEELKSKSRSTHVSLARQAAYLIGRERGYSTPYIGLQINKDHTTVLHGVRRARTLITEDKGFRARLEFALKYLQAWENGEILPTEFPKQQDIQPKKKPRPARRDPLTASLDKQQRKLLASYLRRGVPPECDHPLWWKYNEVHARNVLRRVAKQCEVA